MEVYDYEWIGYIIMAFGLASIVTGAIGGFAAYFKNKFLLGTVRARQFVVLCFIIGLVLLGFGAALLYGRTMVDDVLETEDDCRDSEYFEDADKAVITAASLMCTPVCPCDMSNDLRAKYRQEYNRETIKGNGEAITNCEPCSTSDILPDEIVDSDVCGEVTSENFIDTYFTDDEQKYFDIAEWAEEKWDCAGICTPVIFYVFSDVDR